MVFDPAYEELTGLSETDIAERQKLHGFNEQPSSQPKPVWRIVWEVIKEPMFIFILLVICRTLYMFLGDIGEGIVLLSSVLVIMAITL